MADQALVAEAYKRGLLPPDQAAAYEEAMKRGLVPAVDTSNKYGADLSAIKNIMDRTTTNATEMALNVPGSAIEYGKAIASTVIHPINTAKNLYDVAKGAVQLLSPGEQPDENMAKAVAEAYKKRYGSWEAMRETAIKDPVGFAADVSALMGVVAGGTKLLSTVAEHSGYGGPVLKEISDVAGGAAATADPLSLAKAGIKGTLSLVPKSAEQWVYGSALKPSMKLDQARRMAIIETGLNEGITPNAKGYIKLMDKIDDINTDIAKIVDDASKSGETVKTADIVAKLDDMREYYKYSIEPEPFLQAIDDMEKTFLKRGDTIPIGDAQKIKQTTYQILRKQYGEMKTIGVEAQKTLARGIKETIVNQHPELAALNARDSALLALEDQIDKAASRIGNKDLQAMRTTMAGGMGAAVDIAAGTGGVATTTAVIATLLDHPGPKAALAIALRKARRMQARSKLGPILYPDLLAGRVNEIAAEQQQQDEQNKQ